MLEREDWDGIVDETNSIRVYEDPEIYLPNLEERKEVDVLEGQEIQPDVPKDIRKTFSFRQRLCLSLIIFGQKWKGIEGQYSPIMTPPLQILVSSILSFVGILSLAAIEFWLLPMVSSTEIILLTGAYAATAGMQDHLLHIILLFEIKVYSS